MTDLDGIPLSFRMGFFFGSIIVLQNKVTLINIDNILSYYKTFEIHHMRKTPDANQL